MDIKLDGGEVTVLKAIGFGGGHTDGEALLERVGELDESEFIDTLKGLITCGYVMSDKHSLHNVEDVKRATFYINSGYSRELREALDPKSKSREKPSRRVRRE